MNIYTIAQGGLGFSYSHEHDPFINLSYENWLLGQGLDQWKQDYHLFLYRNQDCVVSGRFQVPWREMNFKSTSFDKVTYVRRRSGGGCVYHDLGNWNYCILRKGRELHRESNLEMMINIVRSHGLLLETNKRFDLLFKGQKVSGSAFKQTKNYSYHHGTLLVEAKLDQLGDLLGITKGWRVEGHGISSLPSPVTNLREHGLYGEFDDFVRTACKELGLAQGRMAPLNLELSEQIANLKGNGWRWGECPKHKVYFNEHFFVEIYKGNIINSSSHEEVLVGLELFSLEKSQYEELQKALSPCIVEDLGKVLLKCRERI